MPSDDWLPKIAIVGPRAAPAPVPQAVAVLAAKAISKAETPPQPKAPRGWRFVPERDANNLIVEIIATPIE